MIETVQAFLTQHLKSLQLVDDSQPYGDDQIHFDELPRDFLKDNDFAACCVRLQDRKKKDGRVISRERTADCSHYTFTRRRYRREVLYRCFLHAASYDELWRSDGLVDQFELAIAKFYTIADGGNRAIEVELHEAVRPSKAQIESNRERARPHVAIVRVEFIGGIYTQWTAPIISSIEFTPEMK